MSTLRTNNLQNPDSAGVNIVMTEGGGAIFSGIVTAPTLNVTGVLTYDDVTNIDSIGVITARSGLDVGTGSALLNFSDGGETKFIEIGATGGVSGGDALLITHSSGSGVGYFGYEAGGDRLVIATDDGSGTNKIDFITDAGTTTGGGTDNLDGKVPKMRIMHDGKIGIGTAIPSKQITVGAAITTSEFQVAPHAGGWDIGVTSGNLAPHYQTHFSLYSGQIGSGTQRFKIDDVGRVTKPYQPSFHATNTTIGQINTDGYGTIVFNDVTNNGNHNIGGHYDASTGVFTAPIAGRYLICARSLTNSTANSNPYVSIYVLLNGGVIAYLGHNHSDFWIMESYSGVLSLAANDTVAISVDQASAHGAQNYSSFSGHLLS